MDRALKRIMDKAKGNGTWDNITATISAPCAPLMTELGPLTEKTMQADTVDAAVMLACTVAKDDQRFLTALEAVRNALVGSGIQATTGTGESGMTLNFNIENLRSSVKDAVGGVPAAPSTAPLLIQLLDVLIIQSVAAIPLVGPGLSAALGGMATGLSYGFTSAGNAIATKFVAVDSKQNPTNTITGATSNWQGYGNSTAKALGKGVSGVVAKDTVFTKGNPGTIQGMVESIGEGDSGSGIGMDLSKAATSASGVASFIYFLSVNRTARSEKKRVGELQKKDENDLKTLVGGNLIQNPLTQNQVANNVQVQRGRGTRSEPPPVVAAGETIKSKLKQENKTLEGFFEKVPDVFDAYRKYLLTLAYQNTLDSFGPMVKAFDDRVEDMKISQKNPRLATTLIENPITRSANIVSLLIMGYYFNRILKTNQKLQKEFAYEVRRYYRNPPVMIGPKALKPSSFESVSKNEGSVAIIEAFKSTQKFGQLTVDGVLIDWSQIQSKSCTYVSLVKAALVNEMAQEFSKSLNNRKGLLEMLQLTIASSLIVNQVMVASTTKGKKIEIDDRYVGILASLGYVNLYTKMVFVTEAKKKELTGSGKTATLRYPKPGRLTTSASEAERTMVYLFACCVLAYVDIGKVVMGYQDWSKTKDSLHELIDAINNAEKD
ncbi:MAG: hypothetical protein B7Y95_24615 [Rhizobiales bacterium 32-66-11]|nr:MAG: hypothetical protein B7Z45_03135 [Azorhizobium sp. 12-66-6]OYX63552.1 MAG: hypothetical protein B7Y95_24615 [Rhizobiales bacterium 32-66-11]